MINRRNLLSGIGASSLPIPITLSMPIQKISSPMFLDMKNDIEYLLKVKTFHHSQLKSNPFPAMGFVLEKINVNYILCNGISFSSIDGVEYYYYSNSSYLQYMNSNTHNNNMSLFFNMNRLQNNVARMSRRGKGNNILIHPNNLEHFNYIYKQFNIKPPVIHTRSWMNKNEVFSFYSGSTEFDKAGITKIVNNEIFYLQNESKIPFAYGCKMKLI